MTTSTKNGIKTEVSASEITFGRMFKNDFQKEGTATVELRQKITTKSFYPSKKVESNLNAGLFDAKEFGFEEQVFTSEENRVAWILVPESKTEKEIVDSLVAVNAARACLYRVLSLAPILDDNQKYAVTQGIRTLDQFANSQALRYPDTEETKLNGTANKLILDKEGNVQYRRVFFWKTPQEDVDARTSVVPYVSVELQAELQGASVMQGQTI